MRNDEKRAAKIIEAANLAISKMTDPAKRDAAKAKLQFAQKKVAEASRQPRFQAARRPRSRGRDLEIDR